MAIFLRIKILATLWMKWRCGFIRFSKKYDRLDQNGHSTASIFDHQRLFMLPLYFTLIRLCNFLQSDKNRLSLVEQNAIWKMEQSYYTDNDTYRNQKGVFAGKQSKLRCGNLHFKIHPHIPLICAIILLCFNSRQTNRSRDGNFNFFLKTSLLEYFPDNRYTR